MLANFFSTRFVITKKHTLKHVLLMNNEAETECLRLKAVTKYKLLDTAQRLDLKDLIEVASDVCGTPVALITLIDDTTQYFKVRKGIEWHSSSREESFCKFTIEQDGVLVIEDT